MELNRWKVRGLNPDGTCPHEDQMIWWDGGKGDNPDWGVLADQWGSHWGMDPEPGTLWMARRITRTPDLTPSIEYGDDHTSVRLSVQLETRAKVWAGTEWAAAAPHVVSLNE